MYPALLNQTQSPPYQGTGGLQLQPRPPATMQPNPTATPQFSAPSSMQPQYNMPQSYAHGGRPKRGKMVMAHMSPKELNVLDHIQGKQERCPRSNMRSYSHLEELLKNPHILHKVHQHVQHHCQGGMAYAHGGHVYDGHPEGHAMASNGIHGDTELAMIGPHTHRVFDGLSRMHGYSAGDLVNPHDGRPQYWSLGNTLSGMYNAVTGLPNTIKQGAEDLYNTGKQGIQGAGNLISQGVNDVYNTGKQGIQGVGNLISQGANDVYNTGKQGIDGIGNVVSQGAQSLYNTGKQGVNDIYGLGKQVVDGAGNLISQGAQEVYNTGKKGAEGAYNLGKEGLDYAKAHPEILQTIGSIGNSVLPALTKAGQEAATERYGAGAGAAVGLLGGLAGKGTDYLANYGKPSTPNTPPTTANNLGNAVGQGAMAGYNHWHGHHDSFPTIPNLGQDGQSATQKTTPGQSIGAALAAAGNSYPGSVGGMVSGVGNGMMRNDNPARIASLGAQGAWMGSQGQSGVADAAKSMMARHGPSNQSPGGSSSLRQLHAGRVQHGYDPADVGDLYS